MKYCKSNKANDKLKCSKVRSGAKSFKVRSGARIFHTIHPATKAKNFLSYLDPQMVCHAPQCRQTSGTSFRQLGGMSAALTLLQYRYCSTLIRRAIHHRQKLTHCYCYANRGHHLKSVPLQCVSLPSKSRTRLHQRV